MGKENKSYRIRTTVGQDSVINFSIDNTVDTLEVLSLKISQENTYKLMGSNTGIVAGRVLANGGFGVPNVKVSVFIPYEDTDNIEQRVLYTYSGTIDRDSNGVRYNLLPDKIDEVCHQNIGTFPSKRVLLDNNNWIDIFDKYYKFTTRTNESGDYMIYGVPTGNQTIHMDADMSDIGVLSQKPRDMIYNGYNGNMFESPTKFKVDTNIDALAQVRTQDQTVYVYPFWGDTTESNLNASITRCDMNINYKFEPTCIFMGSVITDTSENAMTKRCIGAKKQGKMADMITGEGKIEMIRKTPNDQVEQFSINGDNNINGDGVWCYQIPMNLDYVIHDEFGKMVMTDNPNIGIPTRARVRFRLSMSESPSDAIARKRARFLIPNNPRLVEEDYPSYCESKEIDYEFGTKTKNENFRDLFWNNVYTVKSYIPRLQKSRLPNNLKHLGIKTVNHAGGHNPVPFNNLRIKFNFVYMFLCALVKTLVWFVGSINSVLTFIGWILFQIGKFFFNAAKAINIPIFGEHYLDGVAKIFAEYDGHGVKDNDDISPNEYLVKVWNDMQNGSNVCDGIATWFMRIFLGIGCGIELNGLCETDDGEVINVSPGTNDNVRDLLKSKGIMSCNDRVDILYNCIENQLAQDNEVTQFNFYNDWINGVVYLPLWYRKIKPKKEFLFGLIKIDAVDEWCSTDNTINLNRKYKKNIRLYNTNIPKRTIVTGSVKTMGSITPLVNNEDTVSAYANNETGAESINFSQKNDENCYGYQCHKFSRTYFKVYKGIVYEKQTMLGDMVYYYKPCDYDPSTGNSDLVTLFATDLVLLGSLNDCDIHGIPQFFKTLESTTYNMPPDLLSEYYDYTNENNQNENDENDTKEIDLGSKISEYTGADWGNLGADQSNYNESTITILGSTYYTDANENQYDNGGLFYGLTCFESYTKPKSCINLSRICELGVSLDETNELPSTEGTSTNNETDTLTPDGFISYDEIYNPDYRSMFATLNGNFLKTKLNPETGLLVYDFNHMYIDNFDGSLKQLMKAKTVNGYTEKSDFDEKANYINNYNLEQSSDTYLNFRYGNYTKRNGNKIYFYENNNSVGHAGFATILGPTINGKNRQPRYENSFYFYFGLNEGKTAIDKFNNEFFSDCTSKFASDVPYSLTYQGNNWCPINSKDGFIAFDMNIEGPYSVKFTNKDTNDVYFQDNITKAKFIFCDSEYIPEGYSKYDRYDLVEKAMDDIDSTPNIVPIIPNGTYTIELTDSYDNVYDDRITFESPKIGFICDVNPFNCKNVELLERFKDEGELLSKTYADIANHARFVDDNMDVDMNALTYSLFKPNYIIKKNTVFYTKNYFGVFNPSIAATDITVMFGDEYYYYHEPKLDRDIRGFVALSEITEDDFKIDFKPIDTDFFGPNYIGTSVSVHVSYEPYANNSDIAIGETYYYLDNNKYEPMVAQDYIRVPGDNEYTKLYAKPIVDVTENYGDGTYGKYKVGYVIHAGDTYYTRTGSGTSSDPYVYEPIVAQNDIVVDATDEYYYKVDICGYLGYIVLDGVITHYIGVPYGGQKYKIIVTQLCKCDDGLDQSTTDAWCDTKNVVIINIIVYEDEFKMFINGIDYNLIQKFKTGWNDSKLIGGDFKDIDDKYSTFDSENIYGWNDILNIGRYRFREEYLPLSSIGYMRYEPHSSIEEMLNICDALHTNYDGNVIITDPSATPYKWDGMYCYNAQSNDVGYYYKGVVNKKTYTYTITTGVTLYDIDGNEVSDNQIIHGVTYYIDSAHTVEAEIGLDYIETATDELVNVTRDDERINYLDYTDNEYLYDGNTYRYIYPFDTSFYKDGIINGYPSGVRVSLFRKTLRIKDNVTLYKYDGGSYISVTSIQLTSGTVYYTYNGSSYTEAREGSDGVYVLDSPVISYQLETPLYASEYKDDNGLVVVNEDNYGVLTYSIGNNIEYSDLECLTFYDYRDIINKINQTIDNRHELVREVAGTFRINDGETMMTLTAKTKAKPVKYLIAGSSEISIIEKLYNYRPTNPDSGTAIEPFPLVKLQTISDINNTSYVSMASVKNVSDGYVADKNLEIPTVSFSLATLTNDYEFVEWDPLENISNGNEYYSEEVIAYPADTQLEVGLECYLYGTHGGQEGSEYYEWCTLTSSVIASGSDYYYTTGEYVKHESSTTIPMRVREFIKHVHTTSRIWKKSSNEKSYIPYYANKNKHPYYVSVMNDNDSIIPPGKDFSNFAILSDSKNLDSTFGVHFYNKPLKAKFDMLFSFINNVPAYPKYSLGDDSVLGSLYGYSSFKYYKVTLDDDSEVLNEGIVVYAEIYDRNTNEDDRITLRNRYYCYTVGKENYVSLNPRYVISPGEIYYTRLDSFGTYVYLKRTAFEPIEVFFEDTYFTRNERVIDVKEKISAQNGNTNYEPFVVGTHIPIGTYYYTYNGSQYERHISLTVVVVENDNQYYGLNFPVPIMLYHFVKCNDITQYTLYNGDIIYIEEYEPYTPGSIIYENESYYELVNGNFILKIAGNDIQVPIINNRYYIADPNPLKLNRHVVAIPENGNSVSINEYIRLNRTSWRRLKDVYYPTNTEQSVKRINEEEIIIDPIVELIPNRTVQIVRKYKKFNSYTHSYDMPFGICYYNIILDSLNDYNLQVSYEDNNDIGYKWIIDKNDNVVSYNNFGDYRYYALTDTPYSVKLTKRPTDSNGNYLVCSVEPAYHIIYSNDDEIFGYDKIPPQSEFGLTAYQSGAIIPKYTRYYYKIDSNVYEKRRTKAFSITVPSGNDEYYFASFALTGITEENEKDYRGLYTYNNSLNEYVYYGGEITNAREITEHWEAVDVYMPGLMIGYAFNGIPRREGDTSNIKAEFGKNNIHLYTPTTNNPDVYSNINVRRLIYTPNDRYSTDYPATYGIIDDIEPNTGLIYQYAEIPLIDDYFIYTDGYGIDYKYKIIGTLSVHHDNPVFTYFNLGRSYEYAKKNIEYEDFMINKTFYTNDDGYVQHQTLYYVYDLDNTEYPLFYYNTGIPYSAYNSNLKYDSVYDRYYFSQMPEILRNINSSNYISKSKSTHFNVSAYLREKYHQTDVLNEDTGTWEADPNMPLEITRPKDKFFTIACVDGYYTISPVIETQMFLVVLNYTGFNIKSGSPIYIIARDSRDRNSIESMRTGIHYIEDMYYMLYYRFVIHVASFDYTDDGNGNANGRYDTDVYTQVCSVPEGTAEHCYIRVVDEDDGKDGDTYKTLTYWASAIKVNLSSIGGDAADDSGKMYTWLQLIIEDFSGGWRTANMQTEGDKPLTVTEFEDFDSMKQDYDDYMNGVTRN